MSRSPIVYDAVDSETATVVSRISRRCRPIVEGIQSAAPVKLHADPAPNAARASTTLLERGVYLSPFYCAGRRVWWLVDHTHSRIHIEPVGDREDRDAEYLSMTKMLDALDPPRLAIVK